MSRVRGRLTAAEVNNFARPSSEQILTVTGANTPIPIAYGRVPLPGLVFAYGLEGSPQNLVVGVAWCFGQLKEIEAVYINDEAVPSGVSVRHYTGTTWQTADPWLVSAVTAYSDTMVLEKPAGDIGIAYSVFTIPQGELDAAPTFMAVVNSKLVYDPDDTGDGDPYDSDVQLSCTFTGADSSTTFTDDSQNSHTITAHGDADIQSNQLDLDGTDDYASVADHSTLEFGSGAWCLEIRATPRNLTSDDFLVTKGDNSSPNLGLRIRKDAAEIRLYLSSAGTSSDIANGTVVHTLTGTSEFDFKVVFTGTDYVTYVDGAEVSRIASTSTIYNNSEDWTLGARHGGSYEWRGQINCIRLTIGSARYTAPHTITNTPFSDSGTYTAGYVSSDNSALCFGDLAASEIYGLGATVSGLADAADWCDELLGGSIARSKLSLALTAPMKTDAYLDMLATYADCVWFNDENGVTLKPDKPVGVDNPSGQNIVENSDFTADPSPEAWTKGDGWTVGGSPRQASSDGTQSGASDLSQTLTTEADMWFVVSVDLTARSAGSITVEFDGTEVISTQTAVATYTALVQATDASSPLDVVATADFVGSVDNVTCKRLYWLEENFVAGSMTMSGLSDSDTPTRVTVRYTDPSSSKATWDGKSTTYSLPGVSTGDVPLVQTTLQYPGIYRDAEANNKAESRLMRMKNRVQVSWISTDIGIVYQKGDVVQLRSTHRGADINVLVESVQMVSYGRYRVTGMRYDSEHYPSELSLPDGEGVVPEGAIVPLSGTVVPSGWAKYTAADGKFIVCAGDVTASPEAEYDVLDTGGSATHAQFSGSVDTGGSHTGSTTFTVLNSSYSGTGTSSWYAQDSAAGGHDHTFATGTITPDLYRRENILIQKTGSDGTEFPQDALVFGLPGIAIPDLTRITTAAGRLLQAAAANADGGLSNQFLEFTSGSTNDAHDHHTTQGPFAGRNYRPDFSNQLYTPTLQGGSHTHDFTLKLSRKVKRKTLAMYAGTDDYAVAPGMIVLWAGSVGSLPTDWDLCDGTGGTPDLQDYFIEIATEGNEDTAAGDNTIRVSGNGDQVGHSGHNPSAPSVEGKTVNALYHEETVYHTHNVTESDDWTPPYFALAAIMFNP